MRLRFLWGIISLLMVVVSGTPTGAMAPAAGEDKPVVRAVLFWMNTCPHCHEVIERVLPPLQQKYGDQLDILMVEVVSEREWNALVETAIALGIPEPYGVPFLVIGDRALMGSAQIPAELPGLIEKHLAAGGVDYPRLPALAALLPTPASESALCAPATPCAQEMASAPVATSPATEGKGISTGDPARPQPDGFALAVAILAGMIAALIYAIVTVARGLPPRRMPPQTELATPILALAGLGVAVYLAYVETQAVPAVCGPVGDCNAVQSSPYARLFGVLPIGVLGALGYLAILAAWLWGRLRSDRLAPYAPLALFGMSLFGVLFSVYLTYLEPFVIRAVCAWCLTSAAIMTLLMLLSIEPALRAIKVSRE
jgi:uncharacterized membrane protein/thiol-disulfide isomerase/thioredoxin